MVVVVLAIPLAALLNMPSGSNPCSPAHNRTQQYSVHVRHTAVAATTDLVIELDIYPYARMCLLAMMQQVSSEAIALCLGKPSLSETTLQ